MKFAFIRLFMAKPIFLLLISIRGNRMRGSLCSMSKTAFLEGKKQRNEQKGERKKDRDTHRLIDRQTDRQTGRQTEGRTDRQT